MSSPDGRVEQREVDEEAHEAAGGPVEADSSRLVAEDWHYEYCTVLYCTVLYCTVLCCAVLYCTVLYCTVLYCTCIRWSALGFTSSLSPPTSPPSDEAPVSGYAP